MSTRPPGRYRKPKADAVWVRCLGPGPEHRFRSPEVTLVRVCKACREKMSAMSRTAWENPTRTE